jgi:CRISPR-associated protein Cas1
MANLYITEQGAVIHKTGDRLIVRKDEQVILDIPCCKIDAVLVFGNVQFTTQVVHELFRNGIEMALLTRTGRLVGQITSPSTKNIELRMEQFKKYWDDTFRLNIAKIIVSGKISNDLNLIRNFSYNHPEVDFSDETTGLHACLGEVPKAESLGSLMGIEGAAAKTYFGGFGKMILGEFSFEGRRKHPSPDPVNALLSFGYTMVFNEIASLLDGLGFDPYLGYFHSAEYGRASLASDLIEEFRASVDRFTLYLMNNRIFKKEDFYKNPKGEGIYLIREALKRYLSEYERNITREFVHPDTGENTNLRKCFRFQAEKLAAFIKEKSAYTTFALEV